MYTHFPDDLLKQHLSIYLQDVDKYIEWNGMEPTHFIILPETPKV